MPPLRIFVPDDDDVTRSVISALLTFRRDWQICGEASDARTAIQQVELLRPDITLIDSDMPGFDGCEATRQIVLRNPSRKVIVLTNVNDEKAARTVFHAGALGFVVKANAICDLPAAIEAVQRGGTFFTSRFAEKILKSYLQGNPQAASSPNASVSEREREAVRRLTEELAMTLGHEWQRPKTAGVMARYVTIAVLVLATGGIWWYVLDGEPGHPPPAIEKLLVDLHAKATQMLVCGKTSALLFTIALGRMVRENGERTHRLAA